MEFPKRNILQSASTHVSRGYLALNHRQKSDRLSNSAAEFVTHKFTSHKTSITRVYKTTSNDHPHQQSFLVTIGTVSPHHRIIGPNFIGQLHVWALNLTLTVAFLGRPDLFVAICVYKVHANLAKTVLIKNK